MIVPTEDNNDQYLLSCRKEEVQQKGYTTYYIYCTCTCNCYYSRVHIVGCRIQLGDVLVVATASALCRTKISCQGEVGKNAISMYHNGGTLMTSAWNGKPTYREERHAVQTVGTQSQSL